MENWFQKKIENFIRIRGVATMSTATLRRRGVAFAPRVWRRWCVDGSGGLPAGRRPRLERGWVWRQLDCERVRIQPGSVSDADSMPSPGTPLVW